MNFLEHIFHRLRQDANRPVLQQLQDGRKVTAFTSGEFLGLIRAGRDFLRAAGLKKGERCALLAHNTIRWAALDLALMAEGLIVVPLYTRQAPAELVGMMKDCSPALVICGDHELRAGVSANWPAAPRMALFEDIFTRGSGVADDGRAPAALAAFDPVTIIYTSGTSGEPKGVVLNVGNLDHMLRCTAERLDLLMGATQEPERVFHYLPFCFAGSWIMLLSCLSRNAVLTISTDLTRLAEEMQTAAPNYLLNVPTLLERMRSGVEEQVKQRGGLARMVFDHACAASQGRSGLLGPLWLALSNRLVFPVIRQKIGPNLKALICGSAPLAVETQRFFMTLGIPVLQVYGLTETTAICTMDDPRRVEPGKVGPAIPEIEMKLGEDDEILVRGANVFPGYWNRPQETAKALRDGWLRTGDQGEVDESGNWRIIGRIKNLIILNSGHNIAPESIEEMLLRQLPGAQQVVLVGNGRGFLAAIVTGKVSREQVSATLEVVNPQLPHYKRIRAFHLHEEPFSVDNGLLTANGKLKRDAIAARFQAEIEELYRSRQA